MLMLNQFEVTPQERRDVETRLEKVNRRQRWFGVGWLLLVAALVGGAFYLYPRVKNYQAAFLQFADVRHTVESVGDQMKQATAQIEAQGDDQRNLRSQVGQLARSMQTKIEVAAQQARESSADLYTRIQSQVDERLKGFETRVTRLESSSDAQQTRLADLQRELGQARGEIAQQSDELAAVRRQVEQTGADHERQLAALKQGEDSARHDVDSIEAKLSVRRVDFEVTRNHSQELGEGVSLGVTGTDIGHRTISGWMWLMPDRRTIWLKSQNVQTPVVFYGQQDGKKRELVITGVTRSSVTGYLLVPGSQTEKSASRAD
jgi:predicted negative regulator of RcsB-dependent stress response